MDVDVQLYAAAWTTQLANIKANKKRVRAYAVESASADWGAMMLSSKYCSNSISLVGGAGKDRTVEVSIWYVSNSVKANFQFSKTFRLNYIVFSSPTETDWPFGLFLFKFCMLSIHSGYLHALYHAWRRIRGISISVKRLRTLLL